MKSLLNFLGWPVALGVIIALLALLLFPQLRPVSSSPATTSLGGLVSYADAVSHAAPAVVNIYTEKQVAPYMNPNLRRQLGVQGQSQETLGSGVIVDKSGLILTNNHVINSADRILVLLNDGRSASAELLGVDKNNDLAVLKISLDNLTAIEIGDSNQARVGDVVLAIGNPLGIGQSVSQGIVSATRRWNLGINNVENFIQTDAAINPGNSGGALIDAHGKLIGINTAALDETTSVGISFAVPIDIAMKSLNQIIQFGEVRMGMGWLGLDAKFIKNIEGGDYAIKGILVTGVTGPSEKAGLQTDDLITQINDRPAIDARFMFNQLLNLQPGDQVTIKLIRDGKELEIAVTAELRPGSRTET